MDSTTALERISRGKTCLWVGAGVAIQLARAGGTAAPSWNELVAGLELEAAVQPPVGLNELASRLDIVLAKLGRKRFQRELRLRILIPTAQSIVDAWRRNRKTPPPEIAALAHLGFLANPIVNFNIETLSSQALVTGSGAWHPVVFRPPVPDALTSPTSSRGSEDRKRHQRRVYHPHGAIDLSGICVMTEREYRSMDGTLSLQLAVHAAFGLDLAVVGMSLEDQYLRTQLERFRHQIQSVSWFVSSTPRHALVEWAYRTQVDIVEVAWSDFWQHAYRVLVGPDSKALAFEWLSLVLHALHLLGQPISDTANTLLFEHGQDVAAQASWFWKAAMHGEIPKLDPKPLAARARSADEEQVIYDQLEIAKLLA